MRPAGTGHRRTDAAWAVPPGSYEQVFPGRPDQIRQARVFVTGTLHSHPVTESAVLAVSELASNSVAHSASGRSGGQFTVHLDVLPTGTDPRPPDMSQLRYRDRAKVGVRMDRAYQASASYLAKLAGP